MQIIYNGFHYLLQCKDSFSLLTSLTQLGKLPEAMVAVQEIDHLIERMPIFVKDTQVAEDLKVRLPKLTFAIFGLMHFLSGSSVRPRPVSRTNLVMPTQEVLSSPPPKFTSTMSSEV